MDAESDISLLRSVLPAFLCVAELVVAKTDDAKAAQAAVNQDSQLDDEPFHASIYAQLRVIHGLLPQWTSIAGQLSALDAVHQLLTTLEALLHTDSSLGTPQPYPNLHSIKHAVEWEGTDVTANTEHSFHTTIKPFLFCPGTNIREQLEFDLETCAVALDPEFLPASIMDLVKGEKLLHTIGSTYESVRKLEKLISLQLRCSHCTSQHDAMVSFTSGAETFRDCLLSFRSGSREKSIREWKAARIRLQWPTSSAEERQQAVLCEILANGLEEIYLRPYKAGFLQVISETKQKRSGSITLTPLADWLTDPGDSFYPDVKHRLAIVLLLAYAYLHLSGTAFWHDRRVDLDLHFPGDAAGGVLQPYLPFSTSQDYPGGFVENFINAARPSLPAFGKLILTIWLGRIITYEEVPMLAPECQKEAPTIGHQIYTIALACVTAEEDFKHSGPMTQGSPIYEKFTTLVKSLQLVARCAELPPDKFLALLRDSGRPQAELDAQSSAAQRDNTRPIDLTSKQDIRPSEEDHIPAASAEVPQSKYAAEWFFHLRNEAHKAVLSDKRMSSQVKVAIIDTGANFDKNQYRNVHHKCISYRTWCTDDGDIEGQPGCDEVGNVAEQCTAVDDHGPHAVSVLRQVAPHCNIFVAQVFLSKEDITSGKPTEEQACRIANAINYAVNVECVDIISLSFGFAEEVPIINQAIEGAVGRPERPCLVFAAASNFGGNDGVQWPACHDRVICVHAIDGIGNKYARNVTMEDSRKEFATLGCGVKALVKPGVYGTKSGTSVATPVAAGIASLLLDDVLLNRSDYIRQFSEVNSDHYDRKVQKLRSCMGMSNALRMLSIQRDGYNCLQPWKLLHRDFDAKCFRVATILNAAVGGKRIRRSSTHCKTSKRPRD
ncbi:hypothetical protein CKM354_000793900 [Cercospora kikuchii]|uniref:Peptidase S8/S53 domain-containing protein n=1 Tax=Cercospora kikuchii TaxID=84275 RepID=A0A9P3CL00_9PEZI|nr:uncharacterized protein CKM354_000793900 [Cercospora kikuchii]GIZ44749.1 hypothetical protein CKM354_000793900 [Cercospora kikuchii]